MSLGAASQATRQPESRTTVSYSDVGLVCGVVAIIALMIWPLPLPVIDTLVAISMSLAIGMLLVAIYIPSPVAFSSFPSVLMLTTLFRLSLSIAITKQILLNADGGHIIDTFGNMVAGGNLVVGLVVFLIITVVQFIVIAKGAERVAEVAARFTLDAMPGKQLSIDSDLRSGLLDKEEAKRRRRHLEIESQLHGSLDGAMKFVKGDAIAGIVIIIINLLGGLAIGILQVGLPLGEAVQTYSILTIGDGLVAQIPALLSSIAAGLIVTRTASDADDRHLGEAIVRQIGNQPRVLVITGCIAFILMWVPGFPKLVFLMLAVVMLAISAWRFRYENPRLRRLFRLPNDAREQGLQLTSSAKDDLLALPAPLELRLDPSLAERGDVSQLKQAVADCVDGLNRQFGVPVPMPALTVAPLGEDRYELSAAGFRMACGYLRWDQQFVPNSELSSTDGSDPALSYLPALTGHWSSDSTEDGISPAQALSRHIADALRRNLEEFVGIQEVSNLFQRLSDAYPDLVKETLRVIAPQRLAEILKRLVGEGVSIRDLRSVFEALADAGAKEKDIVLLAEYVRIALKRQISDRYAQPDRSLAIVQVDAGLEEQLRQSVRVTSSGSQLAMDPQLASHVLSQLRSLLEQSGQPFVVLCSMDVRRHMRSLIEIEFFDVPVLSYQELTPDLRIKQLGQLTTEQLGLEQGDASALQ